MRLDLIVRDANILTLDGNRPAARSLGVLHGRVVGLDEEIEGLRAERVLNADGATVVPGFNDAHCHTAWYGLTLSQLDLSAARSLDEVHAAVERHARTLPDGSWVVGAGLDHHKTGGRPHRDALDRAAGGRPVWLKHTSGHLCYVSTEVLRRAGALDPGFQAPDGGVVARDADGRPDGLLEETAQQLVQDQVLPYSVETVADAVQAATRRYLAEGVTSFTEAGIGGGWIGQTPVELAAYQLALDTGRLNARAQLMIASDALHPVGGAHPGDGITTGLDLGLRTGLGDDRLSIGPVKIFLDGSLLGRTAAVTEPFCGCRHPADAGSDADSGSDGANRTGYFQQDPEAMAGLVVAAHRAGWNVAAHAIGDRAVDLALDTYERAQREHPRADAIHRVEHAGMVRPDQLARFAGLGVVPVPQHNFLAAFGDAMAANLGPERTGWTYRLGSFLDLGLTVPGSSDRPVAPGAPLPAMEAMVRRLTESGAPFGPDERVSAESALRAWTTGSADATGTASRKGRLRPGMLADFAVLDADPLHTDADRIGAISVLATAVGGAAAHDPHSLVTVPPRSEGRTA
ncbi:hydrolase [Streptomyces abyssalis]|uniref:Hydrolase n=1 Tax=Streptomyces abyssalis TaxID=933944 RepID=A0A1E7JGI9_9ACTN|nr:amidohydrolase [Streptomyces abyssalis]OEU85581.1 hydrolase [Streptomyces abyssalis]OEU92955.1 hydrolase [Streptomyces abyssalis]